MDSEIASSAPFEGRGDTGWTSFGGRERVLMLGAPAKELWSLDPSAVHLNHGSYGAPPKIVQFAHEQVRRRIELHPDAHFDDDVAAAVGQSVARKAATVLGHFIGADPGRVAMVENATMGIAAILRAIPFKRKDRILVTDHQSATVRLAVERRCHETGASPLTVRLPFPIKPGQAMDRIESAIHRERPALAVLDHITSPSAITLPMRSLVYLLHQEGIPVLANGAHALGQLPLDMTSIRADWYVAEAHKWLYAPRGTALLYAAPNARVPRSLAVSLPPRLPFPRDFDDIGTRDYSAWATVPAALQFWQRVAAAGLEPHCTSVIEAGSAILEDIGLTPVAPLAYCSFMRSFILPQRNRAQPGHAAELKRRLWEDARIGVFTHVLKDKLLVRISAQAYVEPADIAALAEALDRGGWPGR